MKLSELKNKENKYSKRLGRGPGSGRGKTSGRGTKGQKSRSGFNIAKRFEGGQSSIIQRLPKKGGFKSKNIKPAVVNLSILEKKFKDGETVSLKTLIDKKIIKPGVKDVKILGGGSITKKIKIIDCKVSKSVKKIIDANIVNK